MSSVAIDVIQTIDKVRVKSGNFGHQVNSDIHLQTMEIQMRRLLMSRLTRIFTICLVNLFFYSNNQNMKQTRSLSNFSRPSEFTQLYPLLFCNCIFYY